MKILVIKDDELTGAYIADGLRDEGHSVDLINNGADELIQASVGRYDALIVDRMLPSLDGVILFRTLRGARNQTPALFLTSLGGVDYKIDGLNAGGDDYLTKPFVFGELSARLATIARRPPMQDQPTVLRAGDLEMNLLSRKVTRAGQPIDLLPREFSLLGSLRLIASLVLAAFSLLTPLASQAASSPTCPEDAEAPYPAFGNIGEAPNVAAWSDLVTLPGNCHIPLQAPATLTIALSGRFIHTGSVDEIAARLGAISKTQDLPYWSVTDRDWRKLVSDAFALESRDTDAVRPDFTSHEMLSGRTLYFAQNDTRSWGLNVYSVRAINSSQDHLVLESDNVSPVRLGPVTLFEPDDLRSVVFIDRLNDTTWTYFSLAVIRHSAVAAREKSLINRQAAFYRLLIGHAPDQDPPLAP